MDGLSNGLIRRVREIVHGTGWDVTETIDSDERYIAVIEKAG
jgi:hypothetical protein